MVQHNYMCGAASPSVAIHRLRCRCLCDHRPSRTCIVSSSFTSTIPQTPMCIPGIHDSLLEVILALTIGGDRSRSRQEKRSGRSDFVCVWVPWCEHGNLNFWEETLLFVCAHQVSHTHKTPGQKCDTSHTVIAGYSQISSGQVLSFLSSHWI
jgi:hypothetical protein